jgi:Na+-transporting NADH:ubiquinone oxidoreductase subunit NqrA
MADKEPWVISGSVLHGHKTEDSLDYLGRLPQPGQRSLKEDGEREFMGWVMPDAECRKFSFLNVLLAVCPGRWGASSPLLPLRMAARRAIVPTGVYRRGDAAGHSADSVAALLW